MLRKRRIKRRIKGTLPRETSTSPRRTSPRRRRRRRRKKGEKMRRRTTTTTMRTTWRTQKTMRRNKND